MKTWQEDRNEAQRLCDLYGLSLTHYNPGDGTKVRIFEGRGKDWFDSHPILITDGKPGGFMQARIFMEGYAHGAEARLASEGLYEAIARPGHG